MYIESRVEQLISGVNQNISIVFLTLTLYHTIPTFNKPEKKKKKAFENIAGKGENAGNQHFLLFPQCFLFIPERISVTFNLKQSQILLFGKELNN